MFDSCRRRVSTAEGNPKAAIVVIKKYPEILMIRPNDSKSVRPIQLRNSVPCEGSWTRGVGRSNTSGDDDAEAARPNVLVYRWISRGLRNSNVVDMDAIGGLGADLQDGLPLQGDKTTENRSDQG